jgi:class 3 adenylate cyclase/tetratricopeptide (TPR) repeat protein
MEVRLLGPVEAVVDERALALGGAKQRAVLAMLALRANAPVSLDQLIEGLWGEEPPRSAPKMVQLYVSRLRKLLEGANAEILTRGRGYELRLPEDAVDALRFERLLSAAEQNASGPGAARGALALWRGPPLVDIAEEPFAATEIRRLEELWLRGRELSIDEALAAREHAAVVGELQELVSRHPLRERLHAQRMLALYRCGRQAEALEAYRHAREVLVGEIGVEPGAELRRLHHAILQQDSALDLATEAERRRPDAGLSPADQEPEGSVPPAVVSLEGERKQVTVLFADVQDSMELVASLDAELWRELLDGFLAIVSQAVQSYDGTLGPFTGHGAMALFGAPVAHEDHAQRACFAALRLRDSLTDFAEGVRAEHGVEFAVRLGLNSGEVVAGAVGEDIRTDYTAVGHTVALAHRMQELAEPAKPYLTGSTAALVEGYFELEDLGELPVKGAREPVHAYGLTGVGAARTRLDAAAARGLSPLVGRGRELAALEAALARAREGGQVVGVVAEPGVGKSRLCHEFAGRCRDRGLEVTVGGGVAHGRRMPLLPVIEMLRGYFGIGGDDDPAAARAKVTARLMSVDEDFRDALPVLFDFIGVRDPEVPVPAQMAPEARLRMLFATMRRLVEAATGEGPGLLVIEDLHWLDPGSEAFLSNLVDSLPGARTLLVVNFRPEYDADWMRRSWYERLPLVPLEHDATAQLVDGLVGSDPSLAGLSGLIAERTRGNPFFIEEVVQELVETGGLEGSSGAYRLAHAIEEIAIPASVQAVLAARIDRLPEREKGVLQSAAVIGREFPEPVLGRVTALPEQELGEALGALASAEFLYQKALYPEARYAFRHPLTQDVADRSQLRERRARTHAAAARALEALHPDRLDELAALISSHWEQAGEPVSAARWGARAAAWAARSDPAEALRQWRRVRALVHDQPDSPEGAGLALGACVWTLHAGARFGLAAEELEETYREAERVAEVTGDKSVLAVVRSAYAVAQVMTGAALEKVIVYRREAQDLAAQAGNVELQVSLGPGIFIAGAGRSREALVELDRIIELAAGDFQLGRQVIGLSAVLLAILYRAAVLMELGRLPEASSALDDCLTLAREHDDLECLAYARSGRGALSFFTGEPRDAVGQAREGLELAERLGGSLARVVTRMYVSFGQLAGGGYEEALAGAGEALEIMRATRTGLAFEALTLFAVAEARRGLHDLAGARAAAAEGAGVAVGRGTRLQEAACRLSLGRAELQEHPNDARVELERALALAGDDGPVYIPHILAALADLARLQGDDDDRLDLLQRAQLLFEGQGATGHARRVARDIAAAAA